MFIKVSRWVLTLYNPSFRGFKIADEDLLIHGYGLKFGINVYVVNLLSIKALSRPVLCFAVLSCPVWSSPPAPPP